MRFKASTSITAMWLMFAASILYAGVQQTGQTGQTGTGATNANSNVTNAGNPGGPGANSGNASLGRGNPGRINTNPDNPPFPGRQQMLTISGTVVLDDGSAPPMGTVIERECGGRKTREANVSPNGLFGFQIGGRSSSDVLPDASDDSSVLSGELGRSSSMGFPNGAMLLAASITGCELRAQLGGYRSTTIMLTANQSMGIIDVGTIVLYPASRVKGSTVSVTSLAAPKVAQKALERADKAFQRKKLDEAEKDALAALHEYPNFAAAWFRLGQVYLQSNRVAEAKSAYAKSMEADANFVNPYFELARLAATDANWEESARLTSRALELDPVDFPYGYYINAVSNFNLGRFDDAEKSVRRLNQLDALHRWPQIHLVMAGILHRKHDYGGEAAQLRVYLKLAPESEDATQVRSRLDTLEKAARN